MANDFAPGLSGIATVNYNGVDLSGADLSMSLRMQVLYDEAERTQDSVLLHFTFRTVLMTADIQEALNSLTVPGGRLRVYDGGFVDYDINSTGGSVKDIAWGPKPRVLNWEPYVGKLGYLLEYEIETRLPYCPDAGVVYQRAIKSLTYSVSHSFDKLGLTTRSISGTLTIPVTRPTQGSRTTPDTAESYYHLIKADVPLGFARADSSRTLSEDRTTLSWSITDEQVESDVPLPDNVIDVDVTERVSSDDLSFSMWTYRLSGTIQIARPYPQALAWKRFMAMMTNRIFTQNKGRDAKKGVLIIRSLEFSDRPYGRLSSFSVSWTLGCPLRDIVAKSGLWTRITAGDWGAWRTQMLAGPWQAYGPAGLKYDKSVDVIIDLCQGGAGAVRERSDPAGSARDGSDEVFRKNRLKPEDAWISWQNWFHWKDASGAIVHVKLADKRVDEGGPRDKKEGYVNEKEQQKFDAAAAQVRVQRVQGHRYRLVQTGRAVRANFPVTIPYVKSVGGKAVKIIGEVKFRTSKQSSATGDDLYIGAWKVEYEVDGAPGGVIDLKDPNELKNK